MGSRCKLQYMIKRFLIISLFFLTTSLSIINPAWSAAPECTSMRVIVPSAVGSATDIITRIYTETINRFSSGPLLKTINVTKKSHIWQNVWEKMDVCSLVVSTQALISEHLSNKRKPKWSLLSPVAMLSRTPLTIVAGLHIPNATFPNLIEKALQDPNAIGVGESRTSLERMMLLFLEDATGVRFRIMTYNTGRQTMIALLSGEVDFGFLSPTGAKRRVDQKQLQALAVTTRERAPILPNVSSLHELGIQADFGVDRLILAPKNTTKETLETISKWFKDASEDPDLSDRLAKYGTLPHYLGPDNTSRYLENKTADWIEMIERAAKKGTRRRPT